MAATVLAAWLVASTSRRRRLAGFRCFLASNALWAIWSWHDQAWALLGLQAFLTLENLRGLRNNSA